MRGTPGSTVPGADERGGDEAIEPGAELGRYRIVGRVGEGGMGVVYEAHDRELDRPVAIKVLRRAGGVGHAARRARLVREAQAMARLAHEHVVPVFDVGEIAGELFLAMELVDGEDLADWLGRAARPWRAVVEVFVQAARGLDAAHRAGVVHRDFKPSNVLVGRDGRVRVLDFGLARTRGEDARGGLDDPAPRTALVTATGAVLGTPAYLAPAQLRGQLADAASDQYAFAVSMREALTGRLPWTSAASREVAPWPARGIPPRLRRLVDRAMAPAPAARFASMTAVIAELTAALAVGRRRRLAFGVAAAIAIAAGAATVIAREAWAGTRPACAGAAALLAGAWDAAQAGRGAREQTATDARAWLDRSTAPPRDLAVTTLSREDVMASFGAARGDHDPGLARSLDNLAPTYVVAHDDASSIGDRQHTPASCRAADTLAALGRDRASLALAEQALAILDTDDGDPVDRAHAASQVALALGALALDLPRARAVMRAARATCAEIGAQMEGTGGRAADTWLAAHP